jgi:hypothetical protein
MSHVRFTSWSCELLVNTQLLNHPYTHFECAGDRRGDMLSKRYFETARMFRRAALRITALAKVCGGELRRPRRLIPPKRWRGKG